MTRPRTGSSYRKHGVVVIAIRLRPGSRSKRWVARCPERSDGVPLDVIHGRKVASDLQRIYDAGEWTPGEQEHVPATLLSSGTPPVRAPLPPSSVIAANAPNSAAPTVVDYIRTWMKTQTYESAPKDRKRVELYIAKSPIATMPLAELRPKSVLAFILWLKEQPSARGGTLAPRTIRSAYDVLRRALDGAVIDEMLAANPCAPIKGKLPPVRDKDPGKRHGWLYTRDEIIQLITDPRVSRVHRVSYALQFFIGIRVGELAVLRWSDCDPTMKPLGRITISRALKSVSKREAETKTAAVKLAPVHPTLADILEPWRREGWAAYRGREPKPGDLVVPNRLGCIRNTNKHNRDLGRDCKRLGISRRHQHAMRHSFITHVQDDGADGSVIRWITHAPPRSGFDSYTRGQWQRLCAEISKLCTEPALESPPTTERSP